MVRGANCVAERRSLYGNDWDAEIMGLQYMVRDRILQLALNDDRIPSCRCSKLSGELKDVKPVAANRGGSSVDHR